jgi:hypothetical protein
LGIGSIGKAEAILSDIVPLSAEVRDCELVVAGGAVANPAWVIYCRPLTPAKLFAHAKLRCLMSACIGSKRPQAEVC